MELAMSRIRIIVWLLTLSQRQILDTSKLKEFVDDNFELDENIRKFSKQVEKTLWEKEKIVRYEQFLLFPQCFRKTCTTDK